jgi:nitroreductase
MSDFFDLVKKRQSCRDYDEQRAVEREKLEKIINAALLSPSACNSQPWHFTVVNSKEKSPLIAAAVQKLGLNKFSSSCPAFIVISEESANITSIAGGKIRDQKFAANDIGIATAHIVLGACELGLSTCIMGMFHEEKVKGICAIPKKKRVRLIIAVGYAKSDQLREKKRKSADQTVTYLV